MNEDNLKPWLTRASRCRPKRWRRCCSLRPGSDFRAAVEREFAHTKAQFETYLAALEKTYKVPVVPDPK